MTPKNENVKQVKIRLSGKSKLTSGKGEKTRHAKSRAAELKSPRNTPIRALPIIIEKALTGDIKVSSKHLKNKRSTCNFKPEVLKAVVIAVSAKIPGITN
jgi:hypothetical protein